MKQPLQRMSWQPFARHAIATLTLLLVLGGAASAQVATSYTFSQFSGTYTAITGGTVVAAPMPDDANYTGLSIGFTFTYNGVASSTFGVQTNGFVFIGTGTPGIIYGTPISTSGNPTTGGIISPFGWDLGGTNNSTSELRYQTTGSAPSRVLTIQWKDVHNWSSTGEFFSFQIKLYETSNNVEFVYGTMSPITTRSAQVGLRGASNSDFNNRSVVSGTNTWATSAAGSSNTATCTVNTTGLVPTSGQTYRWTYTGPPPCPPGTYSTPYVQNFESGAGGWTMGHSNWNVRAPGGTIAGASSGTYALVWQNPSANTYCDVSGTFFTTSPTFNFSSLTQDPVIIFNHKMDNGGDFGWDGGQLKYSTDCGNTWLTLGIYNEPASTAANWYNSSSGVYNGGPEWEYNDRTWRQAARILTGLAGKNNVQFRYQWGGDSFICGGGWAIDDIRIGNYPQKDIEVVDVEMRYAPNTWTRKENKPHTITTWIRANGWEALPTSVTLVYKFGSMPTSTADGVAQTFSPTWSGGVATMDFTTPYVPGPVGGPPTLQPPPSYPSTLYVRAFYTGDGNAANDTYNRTYQIQRDDVYGSEDFNHMFFNGGQRLLGFWPTGWTNPVGVWGVLWGSGIGVPIATTLFSSPTGSTLVSPPAMLEAGSSYRVRFQYGTYGLYTGPQSLELLYGTNPNPATMTVLASWSWTGSSALWPGLINALTPLGVAPFFNTDPSSAQNYYIAFRSTSSASAMDVMVDNIYLDKNPTPPPKIGWGPIGAPEGGHFDKPTDKMTFTAVYKSATGSLSKTWEVVSTTYKYGAPGDFWWDAISITPWIKITKATPNPGQYMPSPFGMDRPRQLQTFTVTVDPTRFAPGTYNGTIQMYGRLYNSDYPAGIDATNQILNVPVVLIVTDVGSGRGAPSVQVCRTNLSTSANWVALNDPNGMPIAELQVTSGTIANICITAYPNQMPIGRPAGYFAPERYFTATASGSFTANIRWYYSDGEAVMGGVTNKAALMPINQASSGGSWTIPTSGLTGWNSNPINNYVQGDGYTTANLGGNHAMAHSRPKLIGEYVPAEYALGQNYPNPFNPESKIDFSISDDVHVKLVVYNSLGEEVMRLVDEVLPAGKYTATFNGKDLPSGTYMYRLIAGSYSESKRMMLAK